MHREYAIDPQSLTDMQALVALIQSFENHPERLVADCPKKWANDVSSAIAALKHQNVLPIQRHSLKDKLKKIVRENLCKSRAASAWDRSAETWLSYAEREHVANAFDAILSDGRPAIAAAVTYPIKDLWMNAPACWMETRQQHVKRSASEIVSLLSPLLRVSKRIALVDPYFSFTNPNWGNYKPLLVELVSRLAGLIGNSTLRTIEIHTSDRYGGLQALMNKEVLPLIPKNFKVICKSWPQIDMHDRFILTDVGGLFLGHGLGVFELNADKQVLASALERKTLKCELSKLDKSPVETALVEK